MSDPIWFDESHFAKQKAAQMNAIAWRDAAGNAKTDWKAEDWPGALARYNSMHHTDYTAYDNFLACDGSGYVAGIELSAVNVSPNALFDIPVYLTNLANHYNNNDIGFSAPGYSSGQWTASRALCYLFENEHTSVWEHFKTYGLQQQINPSNEFDTAAYLQARAQAMGAGHTIGDAIAELLDNGVNPLEDYYIWGQMHNIRPQAVAHPVNADMETWDVWGCPTILPDDKPVDDNNSGGNATVLPDDKPGDNDGNYGSNTPDTTPDQPVTPVRREDEYDKDYQKQDISDNAPATSPDGQNTWFMSAYGANTDDSITPDSIINAGSSALNSLVMDLSADWPGFNGIKTEDGQTEPSVVNVGRVVLNNDAAAAGANLNFDAANIAANVEQFDLNNACNGTISLANLPASVHIINMMNIDTNASGAAPATDIKFATPPQSLRIGLENVCAGEDGAAPISFCGIEEVEIASYGLDNSVNLKDAAGIRKLLIADGAALTIADSNGATIDKYDASTATRNVNIGVSDFKDGAIVKGGSGAADVLTFVDYANVKTANWSGIEELVFRAGGMVDAKNAQGINKITMDSPYGVEIENVAAENLTVMLTENAEQGMARSCAKGVVSGSIGDLTWSSHGIQAAGSELTADFVCNATGDAVIKLEGRDRLGVSSQFEFHDLRGTITIDDPNPTDPDAYLDPSIAGVKLLAEHATGLNVTHSGSMKICGALWEVEDIKATLTDTMGNSGHGLFKLPELPSAHNLDIAADRMDVYISGLGSQNAGKGMDFLIGNASDVYIGDIMGADGSAPISGMIDSFGDVEIGKIATGGDIELVVSGVNIVATPNDYGVNDGFCGAGLNLDFGNVHGSVGSGTMFMDLEALGGCINYKGARGSDNLLIGGLTGGTVSSVATGTGDDEVVVQTLDSIGYGNIATLDVNLGSGSDILRIFSMNQEGHLIVNVAGDNLAGKTVTYECPDNMEINDANAANAALARVNAGFQLASGTRVHDGVFEYGGNAYWIANRYADNVANVTLVVAEGASSSLFVADELAGV